MLTVGGNRTVGRARYGGTGGGGGGGSSTGPGPNEPASMTQVFDEAWDTTPNSRTGVDWITDSTPANFTIETDATAPASPSNVLKVAYPTGFGGGFAPCAAYYGYDNGLGVNTGGVLYCRIHIKVSANWTDNGNYGTKFFFVRPYSGEGSGLATQSNHLFMLTRNSTVDFGFIAQGTFISGGESIHLTSANLAKDTWHDIEMLVTLGTSGAAHDGTAKVWANGTQILDASGIHMLDDSYGVGNGWAYLFLDPTYGGGFNTPPADLDFQIDHWYCSVK